MKPVALISIILFLTSCQRKLTYCPPFEKADFVALVKTFGHSKPSLPGLAPQFYEGLLIGLKDHADIYAIADGIVTSVCTSCAMSALGNRIVMTDEKGTEITYYHLSKVSVTEGASIYQGHKIATSGNSGVTTITNGMGVRIKVRGRFIDPQGLFDELK